ncbi:MAG: ABC transporter substrate-binding protein, partial [Deltaproteobacteria bacterium]|nr:ABC transporter substrate-binding protein [Deltaproteobacteria bacterium]
SLGGAKLELVVADHQMKPEVGIAQAERLIKQEKVAAILGGYMSSVIYTSSQVAEKYNIPYIVEGGTANNICERGFKYVFRAIPNSSRYAIDTMEAIKDLSKGGGKEVKRVGLLYEMTLYGKSAAEEIKKLAPKMGLEVVADLPYPPNTTDFTLSIGKLKAANPDVVVVYPYVTDAIMIVKTIKEMNFDKPVHGSGGFLDPSFIQGLGKMAEYTYHSAYMSKHMKLPGAVRFYENMMKKFGKMATSDAAYSYTAMYILREGLEKAGSLEGKKIREALAGLDIPRAPWAVCSISGVKFDEKGENVYARLATSQFLNGDWRVVWWPEVAAAKAVWSVPKWADRR